MWPFRSRKRSLQDNLRDAFSGYLSDEIIDALAGPQELRVALDKVKLQFLIIQVRDDVLDDIPLHSRRVVEIVRNCEARLVNVLSGVFVVTLNFPHLGSDAEYVDRRADAVARLLSDLGPNVRVIRGEVDGLCGPLGGGDVIGYGPIIPNFVRYLADLMNLDFGKSLDA